MKARQLEEKTISTRMGERKKKVHTRTSRMTEMTEMVGREETSHKTKQNKTDADAGKEHTKKDVENEETILQEKRFRINT
jgi:hypothetical protein